MIELAEPLDVVAIRTRQREVGVLAAREGLIEGKNFPQHQRVRPPIQNPVMKRPQHPMLALGGAHERKAHEGRSTKIKATVTVMVQERLKLLVAVGFRESAPIEPLDGNLDSIDHILHGFRDPFPAKTAVKNRMSVDHALPGTKEPHFVQRFVQRCDHLLDVDAGVSSADSVEEHPSLHRRQFVGLDYMSHGTLPTFLMENLSVCRCCVSARRAVVSVASHNPLSPTSCCDLRQALLKKHAKVEPHTELVLDLSQRLEGQQ